MIKSRNTYSQLGKEELFQRLDAYCGYVMDEISSNKRSAIGSSIVLIFNAVTTNPTALITACAERVGVECVNDTNPHYSLNLIVDAARNSGITSIDKIERYSRMAQKFSAEWNKTERRPKNFLLQQLEKVKMAKSLSY